MVKFLDIYIKIAVVLGLFIAAYVVLVEKEFWKKVAILVVAMLLLPHVSADYKLIHIFLPLFLFINISEIKPPRWSICCVIRPTVDSKRLLPIKQGDFGLRRR